MSVRPIDCPDACSLNVRVQYNKIIKLRGSQFNPVTRGRICKTVAKCYPAFVHAKDRLTQPLLSTGPRGCGNYQPISPDEAIQRVHRGLQQAIDQQGAESILALN